ncbi:superoxide dismutase [Zavarzinella formosa]|uniref:superoxide dismutase n=1 Tax=Zavarzinella formosa TaxID=360055 RepID=UPI00035CF6A4
MFQTAGVAVAGLALPTLTLRAEDKPAGGLFELPKLPYAFDALEPHIDAKTMEIHHDRHHKTYVDNLNKALAGTEWAGKPLDGILSSLDTLPEKIRNAVRNNGGGHYNHTLFWSMMSPKGGKPGADLAAAITEAFKDTDGLFKQLKEAALGRFGSGWSWLVSTGGKLKVVSSPNQDNTVMDKSGTPILGIDVWEHAYYLKYQNKRADYIDAFFKVINWEYVTERFDASKKA